MAPIRQQVISHIWRKVLHMAARVLCILLIAAQGFILNYYMVTAYNKRTCIKVTDNSTNSTALQGCAGAIWWTWSLADIIVVAVFSFAFYYSYRYLKTLKDKSKVEAGSLPLGYVAWGVYAIFLVARVAIIFWNIAENLVEEDFFGPNTLKFALAMSAIIFLLLLMTHHEATPDSERKSYIDKVSASVTSDIFDSVELLNVLFLNESRIIPTFGQHKAILVFSNLNLILPALPLIALSRTRFGHGKMSHTVQTVHKVLYLLMVNIPFLLIRLVLWHVQNINISVFLTKNIIMVGHAIYFIYENIAKIANEDDVDGKDDGEVELQKIGDMHTLPTSSL